MDKSKSDTVGKSVAVLQIVYFVAQTVVRAAQGVTVTPLEVAVASLVVSTGTLYVLCWKKPKSVGVPTTIKYSDGNTSTIRDSLRDYRSEYGWMTVFTHYHEGDPVPNDILLGAAQGAGVAKPTALAMAVLAMSGLHLGAVHFGRLKASLPEASRSVALASCSSSIGVSMASPLRFAHYRTYLEVLPER